MTTRVLSAAFAVALFLCANISAQTSAFTYQGSLKDTNVSANGPYDMSFKLFDALTNGTQIGASLDIPGVQVVNGIFTVNLDFGPAAFTNGSPRFLQIEVRLGGTFGQLTLLSPRQPVASAPFAVKSLSSDTATTATNATQLGGVAASQYVVTTDPRMTDSRSPTAGSTNYIQNGTLQQAATNFNISGNGVAAGSLTAPVINATTEYDIAGVRILSYPGNFNLFAGASAGASNTSGSQNSFFGGNAGLSNSTGSNNSFFGNGAGINNTGGFNNAFFGSAAGSANSTAAANSFFGVSAGQSNSIGANNSYFGAFAGQSNQTGANNAFFGRWAGISNSSGNENVFVGTNSGQTNTTGSGNTTVGFSSDFGSNGLTNATAIGNRSFVSQSNSLVLGSINGVNGASANTNVGIGTTAPGYKLHVKGENIRIEGDSPSTLPRFSIAYNGATAADGKKWQNYVSGNGVNSFLNFTALNDAEDSEQGWLQVVRFGPSVLQVNFPTGDVRVYNKLNVGGNLVVGTFGAAGATPLCSNALSQIATCSSSLRYKTNIGQFSGGLSFVNKLRPISFDWKDGGMKDIGFGAEDIAKIDPRFVTYNDKGEVEGVKYDRMTTVLANAVKEQQEQIEKQQALIEKQQTMIEQLEKRLERLEKTEPK